MKEHNYMGLSDCSSVGSSTISAVSPQTDDKLNLKATELRLGLPGSDSPARDVELHTTTQVFNNEKTLFPLHPSREYDYLQQIAVAGHKRGFSDALDGLMKESILESGKLNGLLLPPRSSPNMDMNSGLAKDIIAASTSTVKEIALSGKSDAVNETITNINNNARATKAQVVGWPPVRSFRQKILANTSKNVDEVEKKPALGALLVKVRMDGAPYLRKVNLRNYSAYQELSYALAKMFSCFTLGPYGSNEVSGGEMLSEIKLKDLVHGSEYVLTYEDKDGDWMLVGDVPWEMFIDACKRLRIMKSVDAIGLAPRTPERTGSVNS